MNIIVVVHLKITLKSNDLEISITYDQTQPHKLTLSAIKIKSYYLMI